jgi:hypothetical protein
MHQLELDTSNLWIVIERKDRRFAVEQKIKLRIEDLYYMKHKT